MGRPRPLATAGIDPIAEEPPPLPQLWNHSRRRLTERAATESQRGARERGPHEPHHLMERSEGGEGDDGTGLLGVDGIEEGPQRGGGEREGRARRGGGGEEGEAVQCPEQGDERVLCRRGVVSTWVAEAAAHDGEHSVGLG
jgi:hypothetical protein